MTRKLFEIIECAFDETKFEEALIEAISDLIDYDAAAEAFVDNMSSEISEAVAEVAQALY